MIKMKSSGRRTFELVLVLLQLLQRLQLASGFCPQHCECVNAFDRATVKCPPQSDLEVIPITLNPSIRELDLVGNRIRAVDASFQFYGQLEHVDFSHNEIPELPSGCFSSQKRLLTLRLDENHLSNVTAESFRGLRSLVSLSLRNNKISSIPEGLFSQLTKLEHLDLGGNLISTVGEDAFRGLAGLRSLGLSHNILGNTVQPSTEKEDSKDGAATAPSISQDAFLPLRSLRNLNLSFCGLGFISEQTLRPLASTLITLDLSENLLRDPVTTSVPALSLLARLEKVRLGGNSLRDLQRIPTSMERLLKLDLTGSRELWRLQLSSVKDHPALNEVVLDGCPMLTSFDSGVEDNTRIGALVGSRSLSEEGSEDKHGLRLSLRNEGWIRVPSSLPHSLRQQRVSPLTLDLSGNPLKCDCHLRELRGLLLASDPSNSSSVQCASPEALRSVALAAVADDELVCVDGDDGDDVFVVTSSGADGGIGLPLDPSDQALLVGLCVLAALGTGLAIFILVHCRSRLPCLPCCRGNYETSSKSCCLCCSNRCLSSSSSLSSSASSPLSMEPTISDCFCCRLSSAGKIRRHHRGHHGHQDHQQLPPSHLRNHQMHTGGGPYTGNPYGVPVSNIYRTSGFDLGGQGSSSSSSTNGGGYASTLRGGSAHRAAQQYYAALTNNPAPVSAPGLPSATQSRQSSSAFDTVNTKTSSVFGGNNSGDDDYFISMTMADGGRHKLVKPIPVSEL